MSEMNDQQARPSEVRISRIVQRAQREVGLRDLLTFCLVQIWTFFLLFGVVCSAWWALIDRQSRPPHANTEY